MRRQIAHVSIALGSLALTLLSSRARADAEPCAAPARGFISASTPADPSWQEVLQHVRSELRLRRIGLCEAPGPNAPLARLAFEGSPEGHVRVALLAGATGELVAERSLDLLSLPRDARLLAIAVATDELLAASLGELERPPARQEKPRAPARSAPRAPAPFAREPRFELGPGFVYESYAGGQALLGADLRGAVRLARPLALMLRVGYRQGLPDTAPHGSLRASAWLGGLGVRVRVLEQGRFQLLVLGRADAMRLTASAYADPGARAQDRSDIALVAAAGPGVGLSLSRHLRLDLDVTAGGALRPVHVTDTGRRVSGVSGFSLAGGGGVSVAF